jgi:hypothetical protein
MDLLAKADDGTDGSLLQWCRFVIDGIQHMVINLDRLLDASFVHGTLLPAATRRAINGGMIAPEYHRAILFASTVPIFDASSIAPLVHRASASQVSRDISRMKAMQLIRATPTERSRTYTLNITGPLLIRPLIAALKHVGLIHHDL